MNGKIWNDMNLKAREDWLKEVTPYFVPWIGNRHGVIKDTKGYLDNKIPNPQEIAIVQGLFPITEAMNCGYVPEKLIVSLEEMKAFETVGLLKRCIELEVPIYAISAKTLKQIEEVGNSQGLIAWIPIPYHELEDIPDEDGILMVLDGVEIPGNVGTILRSAEACLLQGVVLYRRKVRITHPKLLRSSLAAVYRVPVIWEDDFEALRNFLHRRGYRVILADATGGRPYYEMNYDGKIALIMGSEKYGISDEFYDLKAGAAYIPMWGELDSLNVGVAATILMYEASIKNRQLLEGRDG